MLGIIFGIIAGAAMSVQGVFNTAVSDRAGLLESNLIVQGVAFAASLIAAVIFGKGNILSAAEVPRVYLTGGLIGVVITVGVMLAIKNMGAAAAISVILISQLVMAALIDAFGLFGMQKVTFDIYKIIGVVLMTAGMLLIKNGI